MTGNDAGIRRDHPENSLQVREQPVHGTAARHVDVREAAVEEVVAHVDNAGVAEPHDRVAVRVSPGQVDDVDAVAIEVQPDAVVERDHREARWRHVASHQPHAHVLVRDDDAGRSEDRVAPGVIAVIVRVQDVRGRAAAQRLDGRRDPPGEGRELVVHHEHAVGPNADADVPAGALQHVHGPGNVHGLDLDAGEPVLRLCPREPRGRDQGAPQTGGK